jgi:acetylornithine deacetylase/succinyl-diaminopimelate desuccinylase-like protein
VAHLRRLLGALLVTGAVLGCEATTSTPPRVSPRPGSSAAENADCPRAEAFEPQAVSAELSCLLAQYVRIDTTNPPGNELRGAQFLRAVLARDGIESELIESAPGRANLVARLHGQGPGRAVMLVHHMDVVPASPDEWSVPPFSGTIRAGELWGRGSIDDKGSGIAELLLVSISKRLGVPSARDLVLLAVADEESGSAYGSRWLVEHRKDLFTDVDYILNEGGGVLELKGGGPIYNVEVAQKAPLWLRVTAHGPSGHGSAPSPNTAANVLVRALARLAAHHFPISVLPEVQAMFAARAAAMPENERAAYRDLRGALENPRFREEFLKEPHDATLVQDTLAITMLSGSPKENVISERASAVLDLRLLPGEDAAAVTREVERVMAEPGLQIETLLSWRAYASPAETPLFGAIRELAAARDPGAPVTANVIGGFTDCNAFRAQRLICYGFFPLHVTLDDVSRVHGKDERVNVAALTRAVLDLHTLLERLGTAPRGTTESPTAAIRR